MSLILSGTDGLSDVDGTAATPAIRGTDTNTGIFFPAADTVAASTGGTERLRLDSSGNLGLGVTPSAWADYKAIQLPGASFAGFSDGSGNNQAITVANAFFNGSNWIYRASDEASQYRQINGQHQWYTAPSGTAGNTITFTQAMTLDASGNLLVGTTSGAYKFQVQANAATYSSYLANQNANPYGLYIQHNGASPNNSGNEFITFWDTTANRFRVNSNGGIANFQANDINLSDRREKTNFAPAKSYLETICAIPVQTFNYIDQNMEEDPGLTLGVVAQDVQAVAPELVMESNWGTKDEPKMRLSIYQTDLQYALMKAIQEQQAIIESLTARITALEAK